jgi:hypothetical protein
MIGLITSDEVMYAGGTNSNNKEYYLYSGKSYWAMSPYSYSAGSAIVGFVGSDGYLSFYGVNNAIAVRPVVSLKSDAISGESGTVASPFLVG